MKKLPKNFVFAAPRAFGTTSKYDWTVNGLFAPGGVIAEEGVDFTCPVPTFVSIVKDRARKRGFVVKVNKVEGGVAILAREGTPEEKAVMAAKVAQIKERDLRNAEARKAKKKGLADSNGHIPTDEVEDSDTDAEEGDELTEAEEEAAEEGDEEEEETPAPSVKGRKGRK